MISLRTPIKMKILVQGQGGGEVQAAGILAYSEDLNLASNTEIGPKAHFDRGSKESNISLVGSARTMPPHSF